MATQDRRENLWAIVLAAGEGTRLSTLTRALPVTVCRDILQPAKGLAVTPMIDAGWFDCGTPDRLFRAMEPSQEGTRLLERIRRQCPNFDDAWAGTLRKLETRRAN